MTEIDKISIESNLLVMQIIEMWANKIPLPKGVEDDFIYAILDAKLKWAGLRAIIPDYLLVAVSMLSCGNPGVCQLYTKEILMKSRKIVQEHYRKETPIPATVLRTWFTEQKTAPILQNPVAENKYSALWVAQKLPDGGNAVDTVEYWMEIVK